MHDVLIYQCNKKVKKDDIVFILGDHAFSYLKKTEIKEINSKLNGKKILVKGNHDKVSGIVNAINQGYDLVVNEVCLAYGGINFRLSHFPKRSFWYQIKTSIKSLLFPKKFRREYYLADKFHDKRPQYWDGNKWVIHAHTHSKNKINVDLRSVCVSVEAWDYSPTNMNEVVSLIKENSKSK